jgi:group II intron reverse transcriptase/maturase
VDRVVQQAVLQVLEPIFEPTFHNSSHGFRPRRGAQTAIAEAKAYVEQGYDHVVDIDLSKFFDRVNHQRLLGRMSQRVEDGRMLKLIGRMLKAKVVMPDGTVVLTEEGTPQGGPLSPLLSNIVLDELDQELSRRGLRSVRYADDFMVFVRSERSGHRVMGSIRRFIEGRLRLKINDDKSSVARPEQLHFLGFTLWRRNDGRVEVDLSKRSVDRINTRIRELTPRTWGGSFKTCVQKINEHLRGWYGYFRLCTERGARRFSQIDAHTRRRLRAIIAKQKGKRPRFLYRHLRACGVPKGPARKAAYVCRNVWRRSRSFGMHRAYGNAWFAERLMVLWDRWQQDHVEPSRVWHQQLELFGEKRLT